MLQREYYTRQDGVEMVKHYSDLEGYGVKQIGTDFIYEVAEDPVSAGRKYEEVKVPIPE